MNERLVLSAESPVATAGGARLEVDVEALAADSTSRPFSGRILKSSRVP